MGRLKNWEDLGSIEQQGGLNEKIGELWVFNGKFEKSGGFNGRIEEL